MEVLQQKRPGDLVVHVESLEYCTKSAILKNGTGASRVFTDYVGYPLKVGTSGADYDLAVAGEEASVIALLMDSAPGVISETIASNALSAFKYQVLANAPTIVNRNAIRALDVAGGAFNVSTIVTSLKALKWEVRTEPANTTLMDG